MLLECYSKTETSLAKLRKLFESDKEYMKPKEVSEMYGELYNFEAKLERAELWGPRLIRKLEIAPSEPPSLYSRVFSFFRPSQTSTRTLSESHTSEPDDSFHRISWRLSDTLQHRSRYQTVNPTLVPWTSVFHQT